MSNSSATAGMSLEQRILHVGGRNNAAGYIEFGSIQAVAALVGQVLRDLPAAQAGGAAAQPAQIKSPLEKLGDAIQAALSEAPAADVLSILTGSMVGLVVELMRRQGLDASQLINIDGGQSRDITIHPEKRGQLQ